MLKVAD